MQLEPGVMVSHYRLVEKLGEGGMGIVFKALDTSLNRHVALKVLSRDVTRDSEHRLRFQREAQALAALQHPNICVIYEVGEHESVPFLVMEYIEGLSLRRRLEQGALPMREWVQVARGLAEGVAHAHTHGIVHRDLKPDNVLLTGDRQVKILDFGLAKLLDLTALPEGADAGVHTKLDTISGELTRAGSVFGTAAYMSPEQARGQPVDHRTDFFSLGVILYECAAGKRPFHGDSRVETMASILNDEPPALTAASLDVPAEAERIVRKALQKDPGDRYQHADEMATDLRALQRDVDSGRTTGVATSAHAVAAPPGRRRAWLAAAVIVAAIGIAVLVRWGFDRRAGGGATPNARSGGNGAVAVVGFENLLDPDDSDRVGRMLMGLVTTDLAEFGGLEVISVPKVLAALRSVAKTDVFDAANAAEAAQEAGATTMLVGQVGKMGERLVLTTELVDVASGKTLASHREMPASLDDLFGVAGAIADNVRRHLGSEAPAAAPRFDLARALTDSPAAYRKYAAGEIALHQMQFADAIEQFDLAVREDPTFALAYYKRAIAQTWTGRDAEATAGLRQGMQHTDRLPARWRTVFETYLHYAGGEIDAAYEKLQAFLAEEPDIPDAYYTLGEILSHNSRYRDDVRAVELFERCLELDPTFKVVFFHLIDGHLAAWNVDRARELLDAYTSDYPDDAAVLEMEATFLAATGRAKEAIALCERELQRGHTHGAHRLTYFYLSDGQVDRADENANQDLERVMELSEGSGADLGLRIATRGYTQLLRGRFEAAVQDLRLGAAQMALGRLNADAALHHLAIAKLAWRRDDLQGALRAIDAAEAVDAVAGSVHYMRCSLLAQAGRHDEATTALERFRTAMQNVPSPEAPVWLALAEAELALATGDLAVARRRVAAVSEVPRPHRAEWAFLPLQARVQATAGDLHAAVVTYRELVYPDVVTIWDPVGFTLPATYELARLEEEIGDLTSARDHYRKYIDTWGNADVVFPNVADARARYRRLTEGVAP